MTEHDNWARDYIDGTSPTQISSALIALADDVRRAEIDALSFDEMRQVEQSEASRRLAALANATSEVEWQSAQVLFHLAQRVAELKTPR